MCVCEKTEEGETEERRVGELEDQKENERLLWNCGTFPGDREWYIKEKEK